MAEEKQKRAEMMVYLESCRYLSDVGFINNVSVQHSMPIASYILSCYVSLPVKTVIVGERPYATDIHPIVSSAMSYDPSKSGPTPSTTGIAKDLAGALGSKFAPVEEWFRESWRYLNSGTVVVNCGTFIPFSSSSSLSEIIPFQKWLRCLLESSISISDAKIDVICMGIPATNVVDATIQSMGRTRQFVSKKGYPNPAVWCRRGLRDVTSLVSTFGKKGTSVAIQSAISRSSLFEPLTVLDYTNILSTAMASQITQVQNVVDTADTLVSAIDEICKDMDSNHKMPTLMQAKTEFTRALVEYRDSVLRDLVAAHMQSSVDASSKAGKPTEWGNKRPWKKASGSVGTSTKMSVVSETAAEVDQAFVDEPGGTDVEFVSSEHNTNDQLFIDTSGDPVEFIDDTVTETPVAEKPAPVKKKKKTKTVKKSTKASEVEARVSEAAKQELIPRGSSLTEEGITTLRAVSYYLSDSMPVDGDSLRSEVDLAISSGIVTNEHVSLIVSTAMMDLKASGTSAHSSLGLEDGIVSETCFLPRTVSRLSEF